VSPTVRPLGRRLVDAALNLTFVAVLFVACASLVRTQRQELDLFAEFASPAFSLAVCAVAISLIVRRWRLAVLLVCVAALLGWRLTPQWSPQASVSAAGAPPVRIYFANMWWKNHQMERTARSILASNADVAAFVEFTDYHDAASPLLFNRYPYRWDSSLHSEAIGARTVIVSRYPLTPFKERFKGGFSVISRGSGRRVGRSAWWWRT
jgi:endonuclease/exonuclease/phosphatase (EEP) superfamily protein YafD